jgi:hypothetical protein
MKNWTEQELRLALALYCQMPFGKMHSRNPAIIGLAENIGRTPAAVAMKLVNFAGLDPEITANGRVGLGNASALDKQVWKEFHENWDRELLATTESLKALPMETDTNPMQIEDLEAEETTRLALVEIRTKQPIFRRMVLSSYASRCCISGLSDPRLLLPAILFHGIQTRDSASPTQRPVSFRAPRQGFRSWSFSHTPGLYDRRLTTNRHVA